MPPLRIGFIGCGGFAGAHARRMKVLPDVQVVALADVNAAAMASLIQRRLADVPAPRLYEDPQKMLQEARPDAVVIISPHALHARHAIAALKAGCHVLVEKPMAVEVSEAETMVATAASSGKHLMVAYNPLMTRTLAQARQIICQGRLGRLRQISASLAQDWQKLTANTWRQVPDLSGHGQISDSGAHLLAGLCRLAGEPVVAVQADLAIGTGGVPVDGAILLRFANGCRASIAINGTCAANASHADVFCENGRLELDAWNGSFLKVFDAKGSLADLEITGIGEPDSDAAFIACLRGQATNPSDGAFGLEQTRLLQRIRASAGV